MVAPAGRLRRSSSFVCLFARLLASAAALTMPPAEPGLKEALHVVSSALSQDEVLFLLPSLW